jgi:hypothetical protein
MSNYSTYSGYSIQFYFFLTEELENKQEESQLMFFQSGPKYFEVSSIDSLDYLVIVDFYPERYSFLMGKAYDMENIVQEISDYLNAGIASILENRAR